MHTDDLAPPQCARPAQQSGRRRCPHHRTPTGAGPARPPTRWSQYRTWSPTRSPPESPRSPPESPRSTPNLRFTIDWRIPADNNGSEATYRPQPNTSATSSRSPRADPRLRTNLRCARLVPWTSAETSRGLAAGGLRQCRPCPLPLPSSRLNRPLQRRRQRRSVVAAVEHRYATCAEGAYTLGTGTNTGPQIKGPQYLMNVPVDYHQEVR